MKPSSRKPTPAQDTANPAPKRWFRPVTLLLPTWRLWMPALLMLGCALVLTGRSAHDFLSVSSPVPATVLIVEGWLPDYALAQVIVEFDRGQYQLLITTGGPIERGALLAEYATHAEIAAATLLALAFDPQRLVAVPAPPETRHRTRASALAVSTWLEQEGLRPGAVNLVSLGPHARRSWAAYRESLEPAIAVGIIALPPQDYEPARWWASSQGVKVTLTELLAWLHERLFAGGR